VVFSEVVGKNSSVEDVYQVYRSFASEPPKRLPRPGHLLAERYVIRVFVARLLVLPFVRSKVPHIWVEIISENNPLELGSVCLAELEDGADLSLARVDSCKKTHHVIEVVRLNTPVVSEGRVFRYSLREGFGSKGGFTDCVRQNVLDCETEELARLFFRGAVENRMTKSPSIRANFLLLNDAKWTMLKDLYRNSVDAAEKEARSLSENKRIVCSVKTRTAFAQEAYRAFGLKFPPVDTYPSEKLKNLRRHRATMDEMDRALVSGYTTGSFEKLSYQEISVRLSKVCGKQISPDATKKRCHRLRLPKRPPGPRPQ
jgi:hypothetical protein